MGKKIRHTKLRKVEHPYELGADGKRWTVWVTEKGALMVQAEDTSPTLVPMGRTIAMRQTP